MVYNGVLTNLYGQDREDAIAAMDNDEAFDRWRANYEKKKAMESREIAKGGTKPGRIHVSQEEFIAMKGGGWKPPGG